MRYRILADENVDPATVTYLRKLGHDVEVVREVDDPGPGTLDQGILVYARRHERLIFTQDDGFFLDVDPANTPGVLFRKDQRLSGREVGRIIDEISTYVPQDEVVLEYVSANWL
ncbi:hypothetical protein BRC81_10260 [Halobacteriales archaeon QS_1_68_20]|nr:MAG: hypothetical protein BRC81_10260 [Halobacteriales archaeon QS_1_68_20]